MGSLTADACSFTSRAGVQPDVYPVRESERLAAARAVGDSLVLAIAEDDLSEHYLHLGRYHDAGSLLSSALPKFGLLHAVNGSMYAIDGAARPSAPILASANARKERLVAIVQDSLDLQTFDRCWSDEQSMRFDESVAAALTWSRAAETEATPFPPAAAPAC